MTAEKKNAFWKSTGFQTLAAIILGAILGIVFGEKMSAFKFIGDIWINSIKMVIVPLVLCIMVLAIAEQADIAKLGRMAVMVLCYYMVTTMLATVIGLGVSKVVAPGKGASLAGLQATEVSSEGASFTIATFLQGLFSSNMFESFSSGDVLQTLVIAILLGVATLLIKDEGKKQTIIKAFQAINEMISVYVGLTIKLAPIGVLFLIADTFGTYGFAILSSMAGLIGSFYLSILVHVVVCYGLFLLVCKKNIFSFLKTSMPVWTFTMASCSSAATIPVSTKCAREKFHVSKSIANFCVPLGATINCDGNAMLMGCVVIFISQLYGMHFGMLELCKMVLVATLLSGAVVGIPAGGIIKVLIFVQAFNLPVEVVGIIAGFYRFFDMGTTTVNCLGDLVGAVFVNEREKARALRRGQQYNLDE